MAPTACDNQALKHIHLSLDGELRTTAMMPDENVERSQTGRPGNPVWEPAMRWGGGAFLESRHSHHRNMAERMEPCGVGIEVGPMFDGCFSAFNPTTGHSVLCMCCTYWYGTVLYRTDEPHWARPMSSAAVAFGGNV